MTSANFSINHDKYVLPTAEDTKTIQGYDTIASRAQKIAGASFAVTAGSLIFAAAPVVSAVFIGSLAVGVAACLVALWAGVMTMIKTEIAKQEILKAIANGEVPPRQALGIVLYTPWTTFELAQDLKTKNLSDEIKQMLIAAEKAVRPNDKSILAYQLNKV